MDPYVCSIRVKALDSGWEVLGAEAVRYRGVWPENISFTHNEWGADTCSFDLRRAPGALHPDLSAFTDAEIHIAGRLAWSGRVKETPTREGADPVISVQGQGWQYHLDDDSYQRVYVHTRVTDWADMRSAPNATLGAADATASGQVSNDGGLVLSWPDGTALATGAHVGAFLDLGAGSLAKRIVLEYETSAGTSGINFYARGADTPENQSWIAGSYDDAVAGTTLATLGADGSVSGSFATGRRYVQLFLYLTGAPSTLVGDRWVKLKAIRVFTDAAYESGGQSILTADQVIKDALAQATVLLDSDRSGVQAGTFAIPEFLTDGPRTPRDVCQAVNAYENYETKIDDRRPIFRPRATAPVYEIGDWSGAEFEDASANSGEDILNRVIVQATGPDGSQLLEERYATGPGPLDATGVAQPANPSADVDASAWALAVGVPGGVLTRDTVSPHSPPGNFQLTDPSNTLIEAVSDVVSHPFRAGEAYQLVLWASAKRTKGASTPIQGGGYIMVEVDGVEVARNLVNASSFTRIDIPWVQAAAASSYRIRVRMYMVVGSGGSGLHDPILKWDTITLYRSRPTLVDRRGFRRSRVLPLRNRSVQAAMQRIGDLYLGEHRTTPFAGGFQATGVGGVRRVLGGAAVHPGWLGRDTGQLVRASHIIDPDTGGVSRDERITAVSYNHSTLTATVSLAADRGGFDALLERLAVVVGR